MFLIRIRMQAMERAITGEGESFEASMHFNRRIEIAQKLGRLPELFPYYPIFEAPACSLDAGTFYCFIRFSPILIQQNVNSFFISIIISFAYSFIHSFIHSFTHSFIHSLIHSFIHSFIHSIILSFNYFFIYSFKC